MSRAWATHQAEQEENPYDVEPDPGYATGYATTLAGPEVDINQLNSPGVTPGYGSLFDTKIPGATGLFIRAFEMLSGDHPVAKANKKTHAELAISNPGLFTPPAPPDFTKGLYDPNKNWGDIEGITPPAGPYDGVAGGLGKLDIDTDVGGEGPDDTSPPDAPATGLYGTETGTEYGQPQADTNWGDEDTPGDGGGGVGSESTDDAEGMDDAAAEE